VIPVPGKPLVPDLGGADAPVGLPKTVEFENGNGADVGTTLEGPLWPVPMLLEVPKVNPEVGARLVSVVAFPVGAAVDERYGRLVNPVPEPDAEGRIPVLAPAVGVALVAFDNGNGGVRLGAAKDGLVTSVPGNDDAGNVLEIPDDAPVGPNAVVVFVRG